MKATLGMGELGQWWPCVLSIVIMIQFADENLPIAADGGDWYYTSAAVR
jgi:hypothetical protein